MEILKKDYCGSTHGRAARATSWAGCFVLIFTALAQAAPPASQPADPTMDWLMDQATTRPATVPAVASPPQVPFAGKAAETGRVATVTLSDGKQISGRFTTTEGKPVRVWDAEDKEYHDIPFDLIRSMEARITWERQQPEWHFKQSGSDIKEYSGKSYPAREMEYELTLVNGQKLTGGIVAPLYRDDGSGKTTLFVLHKRDKGKVGQTLEQLVYVKQVAFGDAATRPTTAP